MEQQHRQEFGEPKKTVQELTEVELRNAETFFDAEALKFVEKPGQDLDQVALENKKNRVKNLLKECYAYLFGNTDPESNHFSPQRLSQDEWQEIVELTKEFEKVVGLHWKDDQGTDLKELAKKNGEASLAGKFAHAKREDGTEVSVPMSFFDRNVHHLRLKNVIVNTEGGFTIHDVLRAIAGEKYDSHGHRMDTAKKTIDG